MGRTSKKEKVPLVSREKLEQYVNSDYTMAEIAKETGCTLSQIKIACNDMGLKPITAAERMNGYREEAPKVVSKFERKSGSILGPVASRYNLDANPLDLINQARMKTITGR